MFELRIPRFGALPKSKADIPKLDKEALAVSCMVSELSEIIAQNLQRATQQDLRGASGLEIYFDFDEFGVINRGYKWDDFVKKFHKARKALKDKLSVFGYHVSLRIRNYETEKGVHIKLKKA